MLTNIYVKNLALIETMSVDLSSGFSVLTGETGAGKSLILDSMNLFLKNKISKDIIRHGEDFTTASLFFDRIPDEIAERIKEIFPDYDNSEGVLLSRTISSEQKSSCKFNSRTVPFGVASEIASLLFQVSGQNDAIGLQDKKKHVFYLDSSLDEDGKKIKKEYAEVYSEYLKKKNEIEVLSKTDSSPEAIELIDYRIKEIEKAKIKDGEQAMLREKLEELKSRDKITQIISTCNRALSGGEKGRGASYLLNVASEKMDHLAEFPEYKELASRLDKLSREVEDISGEVASLNFETDADRTNELIDKITHRLDIIYRACAKYGPDEKDVLASLEKLKNEKDAAVNSIDLIAEKNKDLDRIKDKLNTVGDKLNEIRHEKAQVLEKDIEKVLKFLDMPSTIFKIEFKKTDGFSEIGTESVEFFISANKGEGLKSLGDIASGGELSRVMLALYMKFGKAKDAPTVVFDEIDTGISGSTSQKIGVCLKNLGIDKQVICVTHSAQVASLANEHFKVSKSEKDGRTQTNVVLLNKEESHRELARILSGEKISDEAIKNAENLCFQGEDLFRKINM